MCFVSKPKQRRNAIEGKTNKNLEADWEKEMVEIKIIKQEHAKITITGRGGSTHKDFSEYFSGIYGKQEKLTLESILQV